jgi:hypothetical protein
MGEEKKNLSREGQEMAMPKRNCWEVKGCGREPGGSRTAELGVCPASLAREYNGVNGGVNGGRFCWFVTGTFCGGKVQGTFAQKRTSCLSCEFMQEVRKEEGAEFVLTR